jgi:hypothetical protein
MAGLGSGRHSWLAWLGCVVCVLGIAGLTLAVVSIARPHNAPKVQVDGQPRSVVLPAHRTYGFFINDADNSGYTESCVVTDRGRHVELKDPGWSMSSSETETLDLVFDTGSGHVTLSCEVPGETVLAKAVPNYLAIVAGLVVGGALTCLGAGLLVAWVLLRRPSLAR